MQRGDVSAEAQKAWLDVIRPELVAMRFETGNEERVCSGDGRSYTRAKVHRALSLDKDSTQNPTTAPRSMPVPLKVDEIDIEMHGYYLLEAQRRNLLCEESLRRVRTGSHVRTHIRHPCSMEDSSSGHAIRRSMLECANDRSHAG